MKSISFNYLVKIHNRMFLLVSIKTDFIIRILTSQKSSILMHNPFPPEKHRDTYFPYVFASPVCFILVT